jgi:outer membrane murein-binding lipoprotein Lpp
LSIQIESDLKEILTRIDTKLDRLSEDVTELKIGQTRLEGKVEAIDEKLSGQIKTVDEKLSGQIKAVDEKLSGQIKAVDEKLSGQIKTVDEKLSGQIKTLDTKVEQLDKRVGNQEFTNRGVLVGLILVILGGAAKFFGMIGNP